MFCGGDRHNRVKCPTRNSECKKCHKSGHWAIVCLSKKSDHKQPAHEIQEHLQDRSQGPYDLSDEFQKITFDSIDMRDGTQVENSQFLPTFNTPFGRFCFKRLPFGPSVSQDVFQAAMDNGLHDLPGIVSVADDIAVYGKTEREHDSNQRALMKGAQEIYMVLNASKCQIKCNEIPFL